MATALYPGAYKPPHKGHFNVAKTLLNGTHQGRLYDIDDYKQAGMASLDGENSQVDRIDKVVVFIGGGIRNGIDQAKAKLIWDMYAKTLPGQVEVIAPEGNPMMAAKDYAKANPNEKFYAVTGIRSEDDLIDLRRITTFKNRENVEGLIVPSRATGSTRATNFRKALLSGELDQVLDFFPSELSRQDILKLTNMLKDAIIAERMAADLEKTMTEWFITEETDEGYSGTPIAHKSVQRSSDRNYLITLYNRIQNQIGGDGIQIDYNQDHIKVSLKGADENPGFDYTPYMASILEYMIDEGMNIQPLPEVVIKKDLAESLDFFGKTAYYSPAENKVVLYTLNRHPKDVMRSFTHEMIHHIQNVEGRLNNLSTSNTNESEHLQEIEQEAYLRGNMTFRMWEDKTKNMQEDVDGKKAFSREVQMSEGKYDSFTNKLSRIAFEAFKDAYDRGDKRAEFEFRVGNPEYDDVDIESTKFEFDFLGVVHFTDDTYKVDGGANAGFDDDGEEIQPMLNVNFQIPKNPDWQEVSMDIKDVVRHELEHLTQDGENVRQGKYIPDDKELRDLIDAGLLDKDSYFTLPKEVDAMIQGLYYKAKKSKQPFAKVVDDYLNKAMISLDNKEKVLILWRKRLPALGIKQRL